MRVDIGKSRANAIREYTSNPMAIEIISPSVFMETCLGYTEDQIEWAHRMRDAEMMEEIEKIKKAQDVLGEGEPEQAPQPKERSKEQRGDTKKKRAMPSASV
jgi:hypothetical protein